MALETGSVGRQYIHCDTHPNVASPFYTSSDKAGTSAKEVLNAINTLVSRSHSSPSTLRACEWNANQIIAGYNAKYERLTFIQKLFVWIFGSRQEVISSYSAIQNTLSYIPPEGKAPGEYKERDDGNCAFLTLVRRTAFKGSLLVDQQNLDVAAQTLREEAVSWIRENFENDERLRDCVSQSMYEHYTAQAKRITDGIGPYDDVQFEQVRAESFKELAGAAYDPSKREEMLKPYLGEMIQRGAFAGAAELYAVGRMYDLFINVHGSEAQVFGREDFHGQGIVHMYLRDNHYNSYYPLTDAR